VRILVISNYYPPVAFGGYEAQCASVVEHLRSSHEVLVLTSTVGRRQVPLESGVRRELPFLAGRTANPRVPFAAVRAARFTRRTLRSFAPDLAYVWNASHLPHVVLALLAQAGVPIVYSVADYSFSGLYRGDQFLKYLLEERRGVAGLWGRVIRATNHFPALQVDASTPRSVGVMWHSEALRRLNAAPPMLRPVIERVVYQNSRQAAAFADIERHPASSPTIALVGRISPEKGPDVAYRALAALRDRHGIKARLVLAGPAERFMRRNLNMLARELRIQDQIELRGPLATTALGELLATAHAIVIPSVWEEPYGLICLEAALARVPIVAARSGGMPEILHENVHALFFPIGDADACAGALAAAFEQPEDTAARTRRAFERAGSFDYLQYLTESERFLEEARHILLHA